MTFLVIAYLRSGDAATLALICGGAAFGAGIIVKFKPYILSRFCGMGPCVGSGVNQWLSADPHHVGCGLRRIAGDGRG